MTDAPKSNVIAAALAGAAVTIGSHYAVQMGIKIPPDAADSLTLVVSVSIAHFWDRIMNPPQVEQGQAPPPPIKTPTQ